MERFERAFRRMRAYTNPFIWRFFSFSKTEAVILEKKAKRFFDLSHNHTRIAVGVLLLVAVGGSLFFAPKSSAMRSTFYPSVCTGDWQNPQNAAGAPSLPDGVAANMFTSNNSAVLGDTHASITCSSFLGTVPDGATPKNFSVKMHWSFDGGWVIHDGVDHTGEPDAAITAPVTTSTPADTSTSSDTTPDTSTTTPDTSSSETPAPDTSSDSTLAPTDTTPSQPATPPAETTAPDTSSDTTPTPPVVSTPDNSVPDTTTPATPVADTPTPDTTTPAPTVAPDTTTVGTPAPDAATPPASVPDTSSVSPDPSLGASVIDALTSDLSQSISPNDLFEVRYTLDGSNWNSLGTVTTSNWQSVTFSIADTNIASWSDLSKLQIGIFPLSQEVQEPAVYLDSIELGVGYDADSTSTVVPTVQVNDPTVGILTPEKDNFTLDEAPTFAVVDPNLSAGDLANLVRDNKATIIKDQYGVLSNPAPQSSNTPAENPDSQTSANTISDLSALIAPSIATVPTTPDTSSSETPAPDTSSDSTLAPTDTTPSQPATPPAETTAPDTSSDTTPTPPVVSTPDNSVPDTTTPATPVADTPTPDTTTPAPTVAPDTTTVGTPAPDAATPPASVQDSSSDTASASSLGAFAGGAFSDTLSVPSIPNTRNLRSSIVRGYLHLRNELRQVLALTFAHSWLALVDGSSAPDIEAVVLDSTGTETTIPAIVERVMVDGKEQDKVTVEKPSDMFRPGKYTLQVTLHTTEADIISEQDFSWGVLAINVDRSIYHPDDTAYVQMGVIDDHGHTICNADMTLVVTSPSGTAETYSTGNASIVREPQCGPNNFISVPDYYAHVPIGHESGVYRMTLSAMTANGPRTIDDSFVVDPHVSFDVERTGPTRIYPVDPYPVTVAVTPTADWTGTITETVPNSFAVSPLTGVAAYDSADTVGTHTVISWKNVTLKAGKTQKFGYSFLAPQISPEFYLLGPLSFYNDGDDPATATPEFHEVRRWQIADDNVCTFTASLSNSWNNASNWSGCTGGGVPTASDSVTIPTGLTANLDVDTPSLQGLTISGTGTLDATALACASGARSCNLSTSTINIAASGGTYKAGTGSTVTLTGTSGTLFTNVGTFNAGTSLVTSTGLGSSTLDAGAFTGSNSFYNLTINNGVANTINLGADIVLTGTTGLTVTTGTLDTTAAGNYNITSTFLSVAGTLRARASTITLNGGTGSTLFTRTGTFTADQSTVIMNPDVTIATLVSAAFQTTNAFYNLTFSPTLTTARAYTISQVIDVTNLFDINPTAGSSALLTVNLTASAYIFTGNITIESSGSATSLLTLVDVGCCYFPQFSSPVLTINNGGTFTAPSGTLSSHQNPDSFPTLTVNAGGTYNGNGTGFTTTTASISGILNGQSTGVSTVSGTMTINSGGVLNGNGMVLQFTGTTGTLFTNNGTFNAGTSDIQVSGIGTGTNVTFNAGAFTGSNSFYNLGFNAASGTPTISLGADIVATGTVATTGTFSPFNVPGLTLGTSTVTLDTTTGGCVTGSTPRSCNITTTLITNRASSTILGRASTITLTGNAGTTSMWTLGGTFTAGTSTVVLTSDANYTTTTPLFGNFSGVNSFYNLTLSPNLATANRTYQLSASSASSEKADATNILDVVPSGSFQLTVSFNISVPPVYSGSTTVIVEATGSATSLFDIPHYCCAPGVVFSAPTLTINTGGTVLNDGNGGTSETFNATTMNVNGGTFTAANTGNPAVVTIGTLSISGGNFNENTSTGLDTDTITTMNISGGNYNMNGSTALITTATLTGGTFNSNTGTATIGTATLTGGTFNVNTSTAVKVTGQMSIGASGTLNGNSGTLTFSASTSGASRPFINNGTFTPGTGTIQYLPSSPGTATIDIENTSYHNLTITSIGGFTSGTYELIGDTSCDSAGTMTISLGTNNTPFTTNGYNITCGKFQIGTQATVTLNANLTLTATSGTLFSIPSATGVTLTSTAANIIATSVGSVTIFSNALTTRAFNNITFSPVLAGSDLTYTMGTMPTALTGDFTMSPSGTANTLTYTLAAALPTIAAAHTIFIQPTGGSALAVFNTNGSSLALSTGHMVIDTHGTLTGNNSPITVTGTTGTLWIQNGTFTGAGTSVTFNGAATSAATFTSSSVGTVTFPNSVGINNASFAAPLGAPTIITNTLTITTGKVDTSSSNYALTAGFISLAASTSTLAIQGSTLTVNGTTTVGSLLSMTAGTISPNTGTILITGSVTSGKLLSATAGTINLGTALTFNGSVTTGTMLLANFGVTLNDNAATITYGGTITTGTLVTTSGIVFGTSTSIVSVSDPVPGVTRATPTLSGGGNTFYILKIVAANATVINQGSNITFSSTAGSKFWIVNGVFNSGSSGGSALITPGSTAIFQMDALATFCEGGTPTGTNSTCDSGATATGGAFPAFPAGRMVFDPASTVVVLVNGAYTFTNTPPYGNLIFRPVLTASQTYSATAESLVYTIAGNFTIAPKASSALQLLISYGGSSSAGYTIVGGTTSLVPQSPATVQLKVSGGDLESWETNNLDIESGGTYLQNASNFSPQPALVVKNNVNVASGGTFTLGTYTFIIGGNWANSGTFTPGASTVVFAGGTQSILSGTTGGNTFYNMYAVPSDGFVTPSASIGSPAIFTYAGHGFNINDPVVFNNGMGGVPAGITVGTEYYVIAEGYSPSQFEVSTTLGGSAIATTSAGLLGFTATKFIGNPTFTASSPIISLPNHGLSIGDAVFFNTSGTMPGTAKAGEIFYVIPAGFSSSQFEVSASSPAGTAFTLTSAGTGTMTASRGMYTAKEVDFTSGSTFTATNAFFAAGHQGGLVKLFSTTPASTWTLVPPVTASNTASYVDVRDSSCSSASSTKFINASTSTDDGNNSLQTAGCWSFAVPYLNFSLSTNAVDFGGLPVATPRYATTGTLSGGWSADSASGYTDDASSQQVTVATSGTGGYNLFVQGSSLSGSSHTFTPVGCTNTTPASFTSASEEFGIRLSKVSGPGAVADGTTIGSCDYGGTGSGFAFGPNTSSGGDKVAAYAGSLITTTTYAVHYVIYALASTPTSNYSTNLTYVAIGNF